MFEQLCVMKHCLVGRLTVGSHCHRFFGHFREDFPLEFVYNTLNLQIFRKVQGFQLHLAL